MEEKKESYESEIWPHHHTLISVMTRNLGSEEEESNRTGVKEASLLREASSRESLLRYGAETSGLFEAPIRQEKITTRDAFTYGQLECTGCVLVTQGVLFNWL